MRLAALKDWRGPRARALKLDPGVLCPNAALEAIAWSEPSNAKDLKALPELKEWFVREFADEILGVLERHDNELASERAAGDDAADASDPAAAAAGSSDGDASAKKKRSRRSGRGRSGASRAKARAKRSEGSSESGSTSRSKSDS